MSAPAYLGALLQLADSALPTGSFSHSFGLESYLASEEVHDEGTLRAWLSEYLRTQLLHTDAVAVRLAYAAVDDGHDRRHGTELEDLDAELGALLIPTQLRAASLAIGRRMLELAREAFPSAAVERYAEAVREGRCQGHASIALAVAGRGAGVPEAVLVEAALHTAITSLTQNAVRAIPLGQLAGQRVLAALRAEIPDVADRSRALDRQEFGAVAPALEIHQMRHEHQRARLFMS